MVSEKLFAHRRNLRMQPVLFEPGYGTQRELTRPELRHLMSAPAPDRPHLIFHKGEHFEAYLPIEPGAKRAAIELSSSPEPAAPVAKKRSTRSKGNKN